MTAPVNYPAAVSRWEKLLTIILFSSLYGRIK
jgi:hypothetical protein